MAKAVKLSVSFSPEVARQLREEVPAGSVSAFIEEAVADRLRNASMRKFLDEMDARYGPLDEDAVEKTMAKMRRLEALPDPPD